MNPERFRLQAQLGAGPDGVAYRALLDDGVTTVVVCDLTAARRNARRWETLAPRLRLAAELDHPASVCVLELGIEEEPPYLILEWAGTSTLAATAGALRRTQPGNRADSRTRLRAGRGASAGTVPRPAQSRTNSHLRRWSAKAQLHRCTGGFPGRAGTDVGRRGGRSQRGSPRRRRKSSHGSLQPRFRDRLVAAKQRRSVESGSRLERA